MIASTEQLLLVKADVRKAGRPASGEVYSRSFCQALNAANWARVRRLLA